MKVLGMLFRIFVTGMIGPTGAAYFTVAYEIYNPLFALATGGLPIAISRMVSENIARSRFKDVRRIHSASIPIFLTTGTVGFIVMVIGSFIVPRLPFVNVPNAVYSVLALSPTILFACLMSIYRGYHQGLRDMVPTALSEIIEASCKFVLGYTISYFIIAKGLSEYAASGTVFGQFYETRESAIGAIMPFAAAGAILGISIGAAAGFIYLLLSHKRRGDGITKAELDNSPEAKAWPLLVKTLIKTAIPIGLGAIIMNVAGLIDMTLILNRIQHVMATAANELLGCYGSSIKPEVLASKDGVHGYLLGCYSFTLPLMMLVPSVTQVFGVVSLPAVTRAYTKKDSKALKRNIESVIQMTTIVAIPAGLTISVLGPYLLRLIYPNRVDAVNIASNIIPILGIATIFTAVSTPFCSMLQATGRVDLPVKIISVGLAIKIAVNYFLVGIPSINIQGVGLGTLAGYAFILLTAMYCLFKETNIIPNLNYTVFKPLCASLVFCVSMFLVINILKKFLSLLICVVISLGSAILVYVFVLIALKIITKEKINYLPKGKKIVKVLEKCHIIK